MNILNKVTMEILKKNRTRTIVTIIGILLSTSMFTAVTTTLSSLRNYLVSNVTHETGNWHVAAYNVDESYYDKLEKEDEKVAAFVSNQNIGYAIAEGSTNEGKPYIYVIGADKEFCDMMPVYVTVGRLPETENEIILPEHLAENGGVVYKLGDSLELEVGDRILEGEKLSQRNAFFTEGPQETIENAKKITYTVVGFYERSSIEDFSAPGYTAITGKTSDNVPLDVYIELENPAHTLDWISEMSEEGTYNDELLMFLGVSKYDSFYTILYGFAAIVCGLIMFGSISLIYNAFSISVSERIKQFGLLSSIGATHKQIRRMVYFEAILVGFVGIFFGVFAGIFGMGVTFHFLGNAFMSLAAYRIPLVLTVEPIGIVTACVFTMVTVLLSAWLPARRATKVTAVEAIRQSKQVKMSRREKRGKRSLGEKLSLRFFGLPGMIANKYYNRSRAKYRATVVSLFMSVVLFISASAFASYLQDTMAQGFGGADYDLTYLCVTDEENMQAENEELAQRISEAKDVTKNAYLHMRVEAVQIPNEYLTKSYVDYIADENSRYKTEQKEGITDVFLYTLFVQDSVFEDFLQENNLDVEKFMDANNPVAVAFDEANVWDFDLQKYVAVDVLNGEGGTISFETDDKEMTIQIGKVLLERPYYVDPLYRVCVMYPYSMRDVVLTEFGEKDRSVAHYICSDDHKNSEQAISSILTEKGLTKSRLNNIAEMNESDENLVLIINVFAYGFIALISLIAVANVFNTISTNIALRRRDFAMLRSVGMSDKEMHRMMSFECVLYGSRALMFGLPVSVFVTWLIYLTASSGIATGFYLPWIAIGIAVFSVFAVVFITMMYAMSKIKKDNPIDALRNENL